jgi:hypothetical protein
MSKQLYQIRVIPEIKTEQGANGTETHAVYERTTNPSQGARANGYDEDQFFHLGLSKVSDNPLDTDLKEYPLILFASTYKKHFSIIKDQVDNFKGKTLSDKSIILEIQYPGLLLERKCPTYFGTTTVDGIEKIITVKKKMVNTATGEITYVPEQMRVNTVKFFVFSSEMEEGNEEEGIEIAYQKEVARHSNWFVDKGANSTANDLLNEQPVVKEPVVQQQPVNQQQNNGQQQGNNQNQGNNQGGGNNQGNGNGNNQNQGPKVINRGRLD